MTNFNLTIKIPKKNGIISNGFGSLGIVWYQKIVAVLKSTCMLGHTYDYIITPILLV